MTNARLLGIFLTVCMAVVVVVPLLLGSQFSPIAAAVLVGSVMLTMVLGSAGIGWVTELRRQREHKHIRAWGRRHGFIKWTEGNVDLDTSTVVFRENTTTTEQSDVVPQCDSVLLGQTIDGRALAVAHLVWPKPRAHWWAVMPIVGAAFFSSGIREWTFIQIRLAKAESHAYGGRMALASRGPLDRRLFDGLEDVVSSLENVELESAEFERDFSLRVSRRVNPLAMRSMFSPKFIAWLIDWAPTNLFLQLEEHTLTVGVAERVTGNAGLDRLLNSALLSLDGVIAGAKTVGASARTVKPTQGVAQWR